MTHAPKILLVLLALAVTLAAVSLWPTSAIQSGYPGTGEVPALHAPPVRLDLRAMLSPGGFTAPGGDATAHDFVDFVTRGGGLHARVRGGTLQVLSADGRPDRTFQFVAARRDLQPRLQESFTPPVTLFGANPRAPRRAASRFRSLRYDSLYPGIDVVYYVSRNERLQFDLLLAPGADPEQILLRIPEGSSLRLDGRAHIHGDHEPITLERPVAFQEVSGQRRPVAVRYRAHGGDLSFELGPYDESLPLVIDPLVVANSTFVGSTSNDDVIHGMTVDAQGNIYLTGVTDINPQAPGYAGFPTTPGSYRSGVPLLPDECAYQCGFIVKLNPQYEVQYGALIYGITPLAIAVDGSQQAHVTGRAGGLFSPTPGVFASDPGGQAFVTKLAADGSSLVYQAQFQAVEGRAIALDVDGNAYVAGLSEGPALPTSPGTIKPGYQATGDLINEDGFLLKVNPPGNSLLYGTYLGGTGADSVQGLAVDGAGRAVVVGRSASADFVGFPGAVAGGRDAFVLRVAADGSSVEAGRRFGGSADDIASAVAADQQGGWIVGGATESPELQVTAGVFQDRLLGERNGWLARLAADLSPRYVTYFGGEWIDGVLAVASDAEANAYFAGIAFSKQMPTTSDGFEDVTSLGLREAYFGVLDAAGGVLRHGTYLGGYYTEPRGYDVFSAGSAIARTADGTVYVGGSTTAASFPTTADGLRAGMGGIADGFLVRLVDSPLQVTTGSLLPVARLEQAYQVALNAAGGVPPYQWSVVGFAVPDGMTLSAAGVLSGAPLNPQTEANEYQFTVQVRDALGREAHKSLFLGIISPGQLDCSSGTCSLSLLVGQSIAYPLGNRFRGATPPFSWSTSGTLPPGVSLSAAGTLQGAPAVAGVFDFRVHLVDANQSAWFADFRITATAPPGGGGGGGGGGGDGGSGGGGGAMDELTLLLLCLLLGRAYRKRGAN